MHELDNQIQELRKLAAKDEKDESSALENIIVDWQQACEVRAQYKMRWSEQDQHLTKAENEKSQKNDARQAVMGKIDAERAKTEPDKKLLHELINQAEDLTIGIEDLKTYIADLRPQVAQALQSYEDQTETCNLLKRPLDDVLMGIDHAYDLLDDFAFRNFREITKLDRSDEWIDVSHNESDPQSYVTLREFKFRDSDFEQKLQALTIHLTDKRIAEEMDTGVYLDRCRNYFRRAGDRANRIVAHHLENLNQAVEQGSPVKGKLDELGDVHQRILDVLSEFKAVEIHDEMPPRLKGPVLKNTQGRYDAIDSKLSQIHSFVTEMRKRFMVFSNRYCSDHAIGEVQEGVAWVSTHITQGRFLRKWPFLVALATATAGALLLSLDRSIWVQMYFGWIVLGILGVTYFASWFFGVKQREEYMYKFRHAFIKQTAELFGARPWDISRPFRFPSEALTNFGNNDLEEKYKSFSLDFDPRAYDTDASRAMKRSNLSVVVAVLSCCAAVLFFPQQLNENPKYGYYEALALGRSGVHCGLVKGYFIGGNSQSYRFEQTRSKKPFIYNNVVEVTRDRIEKLVAGDPLADGFTGGEECNDSPSPQLQITQAAATPFGLDHTGLVDAIGKMTNVQNYVIHGGTDGSGIFDVSQKIDELKSETLKNIHLVSEKIDDVEASPLIVLPLVRVAERQPVTFETKVQIETGQSRGFENTILLPHFIDPVKGMDPDWIFEFGRNTLRDAEFLPLDEKDGVNLPEKARNRIEYLDFFIGEIIASAVSLGPPDASDTSLKIDVQGFASEQWEGVVEPNEQTDGWNHLLSEGRRAGVLDRFKQAAAAAKLPVNLFLQSSETECIRLGDWDETQKRFKDFGEMREELEKYSDETNQLGNRLQQVFERSVIIRVYPVRVGDASRNGRFECGDTSTPQDVAGAQ